MNDQGSKSKPGISFHITTKSHRLHHKPDEVANVWVYVDGYDTSASLGFHDKMIFHDSEVTLEQLELLQKMQLSFARQSFDMKGGTIDEIHE